MKIIRLMQYRAFLFFIIPLFFVGIAHGEQKTASSKHLELPPSMHELSKTNDELAEEKDAEEVAKLRRLQPDLSEVVASAEFAAWRKLQDSDIRMLLDSDRAESVSAAINIYKHHLKQKQHLHENKNNGATMLFIAIAIMLAVYFASTSIAKSIFKKRLGFLTAFVCALAMAISAFMLQLALIDLVFGIGQDVLAGNINGGAAAKSSMITALISSVISWTATRAVPKSVGGKTL